MYINSTEKETPRKENASVFGITDTDPNPGSATYLAV